MSEKKEEQKKIEESKDVKDINASTSKSSATKDSKDKEKVDLKKEEKKKSEEKKEENQDENLDDLFSDDNKDSKDKKSEKKDNIIDDDLPEEVKKRLEKKSQDKKSKKPFKKKKKKVNKQVKVGKAFIKSTYNNTIVTLTDLDGNVLSWASAGIAGFKGPKKATPYAAQIITKIASKKAREEFNLEEISIFVKGIGTGRESAIRALNANGFNITSIKDVTPIPHNGCRARRPRRV